MPKIFLNSFTGCAAYAEVCAAYAEGCAAYVQGCAAYIRHCENKADSIQLRLAIL